MTFIGLLLCSVVSFAADTLQELADDGRWDELIVVAEARLEVAPADPEARYWLGRAWLARGEGLLAASDSQFSRDLADSSLGRAIDAFSDVPSRDGVTADSREWWAYARMLRGDADLIEDVEVWFAESGAGYAAFVRGMLARSGGLEDAEVWLERAAAAEPGRPEFQLAYCDVLASRGEAERALAAWQAARKCGAERNALLRSLLGALPDASDATRRLQLIEEITASDPAAQHDGWLAWYRAHALEQVGRIAEAESALAAADRERGVEVDRFHAHLLSRLQRHEDALKRLLPWVALLDSDATTEAIDLCDSLALGQRWSVAIAAYDEVLRNQTENERAARNRALTMSRAGREEEAVRAWADLVSRYEGRADVLNDAALMLEGMGRLGDAGPLFERAAALDPVGPAAENLADHLLEENPERALALLDRVVDAVPTRDRALYLRKQARQTQFR